MEVIPLMDDSPKAVARRAAIRRNALKKHRIWTSDDRIVAGKPDAVGHESKQQFPLSPKRRRRRR